MEDNEIIEALKAGTRSKALSRLYKYFPKVERLILSRGGNKDDAWDMYQEGLIILCNKLLLPDFRLSCSMNTFLYSICGYLWNNELKKRTGRQLSPAPAEAIANDDIDYEELLREEEKINKAEKALKQLGERCLELLNMFYGQKKSMIEIAAALGFSSENVAKNQKYKCLERARQTFREKTTEYKH